MQEKPSRNHLKRVAQLLHGRVALGAPQLRDRLEQQERSRRRLDFPRIESQHARALLRLRGFPASEVPDAIHGGQQRDDQDERNLHEAAFRQLQQVNRIGIGMSSAEMGMER
ncbi:MAG TPA: hypothetical protein VFP80_10320 [Thermoanaerobaculia bacterium]|nr:hypothetical protein [Thermoanaerobaculia bacterium]